MTVQNFAFGELNMCSKLWCNHWLSCRNRRLNCYVLTRFKLDNCFHAWLTCLQRNWCALASNTSAANERWPIQTTHTVTCKCCGFFQYTLLQTMPAIHCHTVLTLDLPQIIGTTGQPIAYKLAEMRWKIKFGKLQMTLWSVKFRSSPNFPQYSRYL